MPNIDTLSIQFNANGTDKAIKNIKAMGYAVRNLAQSVKSIDTNKMSAFTSSMETIKKSVPTEAQTNRMVAFSEAVKSLSSAISSANIGVFSKDMSTLGEAVNTFKKSSVNSITNAVTAMKNMGQTAQQTATAINNATPKKSQDVKRGDNKGTLEQAKEMFAALDKVEIKATGIARVMEKLGLNTPTKKFKDLENQAEKVRQKYEELRTTLNKALQSGEIQTDSGEFRKKQAELDALKNSYNELILKQRELAQEGGRFTINPAVANAVEKVKTSFNGLQTLLNGVNSGLKSVTSVADRFVSKLRNMGKSAKTAKKETTSLADAAKKLSNEFFRVSKMLKLMVTRMALRAVIKEVGEGFKSLALHSDEFNKSMSGIMNASKQLGYSFAAMVSPLIEKFAPAIIYVINLFIKLTNIINQLFASLSGKKTYEKAIEFTDDWRKSIEDSNKEGKKLKKTVLGFDELNQLTDKTKGQDDSKNIKDMFETVAIEQKWKKLADYIKKIAKKLFDPIKKAWEKVGTFVKNAWKRALNEVLKLGQSIARDFWKVWEEDKTQKILEDIFKIIGLIGVVVGTLAKKFREAWDANNTGLKILRNIRDIIGIIVKWILVMAIATAKWAETLDFSPILTKFNEWFDSVKPVVNAFMGIISDFYTTVILPLAKWAIEEGGPQLLKVFKDFNEEVDWVALRTNLKELWDHVEPFMETVGEGLILFIDRVADSLAKFLNSGDFVDFLHSVEDWMDSVTAEDVADAIEKIVKFYLGIKIAGMLLTVFSKILTVISAIGSSLGVIIGLLKGAFVIAVALLGLDLGTRLGALFDPETYGEFVGHPLLLLYTTVVAIKDGVDMLIEDIKELFDMANLNSLSRLTGFMANVSEFFNFPGADYLKRASEEVENLANSAWYADVQVEQFHKRMEQSEFVSKIMSDASKGVTDALNMLTGSADNASEATKKISDETGKVASQISDAKTNAGNLSQTIGKTSEKMNDMADKGKDLKESLYNTSETFKTLSNNIKDTKAASSYYNSLKGDVEKDSKGIASSVNGIDFSEADRMWDEFVKENGDLFKDLGTDVGDSTSDIQKYLDELDFSDVNTEFADFSKNTDTSMADAKKVVEESTKDITSDFDLISKSMTKEKWTFQGVADGFKETFRRAREAIKGEWNQIADKLNGEHEVGTEKIKIDLPKFARGGFPEDGLFYANHSELVGKFSNGKNAVANNAQIIDGIANGVYQATVRANAQNNGNGKYISNTIVVDGEVIARTVTKAQERQSMRYSPVTI